MARFRFNAARWLDAFEACGGRFTPIERGALTSAPWPGSKADRMQARILTSRAKWIAVYQASALRGAGATTASLEA